MYYCQDANMYEKVTSVISWNCPTSDNYRGISLFYAICKLFDNVILVLYGDELQSSDMQFRYKQGHSTTLCTLIYEEVVHHYLNSGSNVYRCCWMHQKHLTEFIMEPCSEYY